MRQIPDSYDFHESIQSQTQYFRAFQQWLECRTAIQEVCLASQHEDRELGIDLWAKTVNGASLSIQVKVDFWSHSTENFVFEVISQARSSTEAVLGWGFHTEADYLAFVIAGTGDIYVFRTVDYTRWVIEHYATLENFASPNKSYRTLGCKVPIMRVSHLCCIRGNLDDFNPAILEYQGDSPFAPGETDDEED